MKPWLVRSAFIAAMVMTAALFLRDSFFGSPFVDDPAVLFSCEAGDCTAQLVPPR